MTTDVATGTLHVTRLTEVVGHSLSHNHTHTYTHHDAITKRHQLSSLCELLPSCEPKSVEYAILT